MVVFRCYTDITIFLIGSITDNELILAGALDTLHVCLEVAFRDGLERKSTIQHMTTFLLIIDDIIDHGYVESPNLA